MKAVALAAKARSLADFQKAVKAYKVYQLSFTGIVQAYCGEMATE